MKNINEVLKQIIKGEKDYANTRNNLHDLKLKLSSLLEKKIFEILEVEKNDTIVPKMGEHTGKELMLVGAIGHMSPWVKKELIDKNSEDQLLIITLVCYSRNDSGDFTRLVHVFEIKNKDDFYKLKKENKID